MDVGRQVWMELLSRDVLKAVMQARGETVRSLAKRAGVSHSLIGHLTSGARSTCTPDSAKAVAKALGVEPTSLFAVRVSPRRRAA